MTAEQIAARIVDAAPGAEPGSAGLLRGLFGGTSEEAAGFAVAHWGLVHLTGKAETPDVREVQAEVLRRIRRPQG